jgi:NitT/TauT family transport system substrate-binding protein
VQALADIDPLPYLWLKDGKLIEIATNLSGEYADRTCCLLAIRGNLIRNELPVAAALTRSILEAADRVAGDPADAAAVYSGYGGRGSVEDLAAMLRSHTHHNHPGRSRAEETALALHRRTQGSECHQAEH